MVYIALCRHTDKEQTSFPSQDNLAERLGCSRFTVIRAINLLRKLNIISLEKPRNERGKFRHNVYTLLDSSEWAMPIKPSCKGATRLPVLQMGHSPCSTGATLIKLIDITKPINTLRAASPDAPAVLDEMIEIKKREQIPNEWNSKAMFEYLQSLRSGTSKHLRVVGNFMIMKGVSLTNYQTKKQFEFEARRHSKAASRLAKAFDEERIDRVMAFLKENAKFAWTLETCEKFITVENLTPDMLPKRYNYGKN